jgi:hypothetical protein
VSGTHVDSVAQYYLWIEVSLHSGLSEGIAQLLNNVVWCGGNNSNNNRTIRVGVWLVRGAFDTPCRLEDRLRQDCPAILPPRYVISYRCQNDGAFVLCCSGALLLLLLSRLSTVSCPHIHPSLLYCYSPDNKHATRAIEETVRTSRRIRRQRAWCKST